MHLKKRALSAFPAFLKSKGAKEKVVTRIMVSRCEVDLMKIRTEFKRLHGRSLYQTISVSNSHKTLYFQYHNDCIVNDVVNLLKFDQICKKLIETLNNEIPLKKISTRSYMEFM